MTPERSPQQHDEHIFAKGKLFELVHVEQPDGRVFELARRAPGVRLIIADHEAEKILLTKEFRQELNEWDYRLPGGKVFDNLDEFESFRSTDGSMSLVAERKAKEEAIEEAGIQINTLSEFKKSTLGATVEWDLFVYEARDWQRHEAGQQLEVGEAIETDNWFTYDEVAAMVLAGDMKEERVALILLQWVSKQKEEK